MCEVPVISASGKTASEACFVRLQKWSRDSVLTFVPPDGHFTLMEYRYALPSSGIANTRQIPVPFTLVPTILVSENGGGPYFSLTMRLLTMVYLNIGTFDFTLSSRLSTRLIERITIELYLGDDATGANCTVSSGASWGFNPKTRVWSPFTNLLVPSSYLAMKTLSWEILKAPQGSSHNLRGTFSAP